MTLTLSSLTLEINRNHVFASLGGREAYVKFGSGLPFRFFSKEHQKGSLEVWGFGLYAVVSRA